MLLRPYDQPWQNNYARQANDAFYRATEATDEELRQLRPPLPQIIMNPPRFGYPSYADRQWDIMQVFGITRSPMGSLPPRSEMGIKQKDRVDYSREQGHYEGSDRNTNFDPLGLGTTGTGN